MSDTGGAALPTGCYKCGRPGHWSRDCPSSSSSNPNPNPNPNPSSGPTSSTTAYPNTSSFTSTTFSKSGHGSSFKPKASTAASKPKKAPKTRPKLTPEILLSDEGLGYILRYFPRNFKYRGRGHEVSDLRNLLHMYADWHSQFLPYFPFDQFIHKVEEAGSSRRLRTCIGELKDRVANGGDPTKLKESVTENETFNDKEDFVNTEEPTHQQEDLAFKDNNADDMHEDIFNEMYNKTVEETSHNVEARGVDIPLSDKFVENSEKAAENGGGNSSFIQVTQEQKAIMEAKRLKALERAAIRSRLLPTS